jgi:hypothetical protein
MTDQGAVLREIWFGQVWRANAVRLVEERDGLLVFASPPGSPAKYPVENGREVRIPRAGVTLADRIAEQQALFLVRPGARHSLLLFWAADGRFDYWYVNFERDVRRTPLGVDYVDEKLDLVVAADGSVRWKDEDELAEAERLGLLDAAEVRAEAERVLAAPPWPTGWESWRWEPGLPVPRLPEGWDVV